MKLRLGNKRRGVSSTIFQYSNRGLVPLTVSVSATYPYQSAYDAGSCFIPLARAKNTVSVLSSDDSSVYLFSLFCNESVWKSSSPQRIAFTLKTALSSAKSCTKLAGLSYKGVFTTRLLNVVTEIWDKLEERHDELKAPSSMADMIQKVKHGLGDITVRLRKYHLRNASKSSTAHTCLVDEFVSNTIEKNKKTS